MTEISDFLHRVATAQERIAAAYEDLAETMHELPAIMNGVPTTLPIPAENFKPTETKVVEPETKETPKKRTCRTKEQIAADKAVKEATKVVDKKVEAEATEDNADVATQEEVRAALIAFSKKGGKTAKNEAIKILASEGDGATKISEIPETHYQAVLDALEQAEEELDKAA